jgi:hypothetical protein
MNSDSKGMHMTKNYTALSAPDRRSHQIIENIQAKTREMKPKARLIAHYLPQFHPIPENDAWWGKGFTEWTNVASAKPLFPGHYQPHIPSDLGFYDLRLPETRVAQAELAREYGIEGFIYWHYWFGGKRLLERPFNDIIKSGEPDYPFCVAWANTNWTGEWAGNPKQVLQEQLYPGIEDYETHFYTLLPAFQDKRYIKADGKPLFFILKPEGIPDPKRFTDYWQKLAVKEGLEEIYFVVYSWGHPDGAWNPESAGYNAFTYGHQSTMKKVRKIRIRLERKYRKLRNWPIHAYNYEDALPYLLFNKNFEYIEYPTVIPNWDNSPRVGKRAMILHNSTPELFRIHLKCALDKVVRRPFEHRIIFVKSWNEWAEGNHLEPDRKFGKDYLRVIREEVCL